ncbi:hypothetical protein HUS23_11525 [Ectothiorhodospiraceae bacterium 2226]|nr:hypothetical protein HUS23_11525 [Ectothiorhodospiraceae bacterium 2226]
MRITTWLFAVVLSLLLAPAHADQALKPFVLAGSETGDMDAVADGVKERLARAGFEVVGEYDPYDGAKIIGVTHASLLKTAARSDFGGYGAVQRVALTRMDGKIQVSYTNPSYMAAAYRMANDLGDITAALDAALGAEQQFGPADGLTPRQLSRYRYMFGMERFDAPMVLATHNSHDEALRVLEANLAKGAGGVHKVYRVDLPGKRETVFGVAMRDAETGDAWVMSEIDFKPVRSTAHLPYEILVTDGTVRALHARFRIAMNFPDLSMMGANSFMNIRSAPGHIETALTAAAGGTIESVWD